MINKMTHDEHGFSLMELILVMSLIGIMTFVAIPAITNTQGISMNSAAQKMESDLRYAQSQAMTTGDDYGFRTTGTENTGYEVYKVSTNEAAQSPYDRQAMQEDLSEEYGGITITESVDITFDEQGIPNIITGDNTVTLKNTSDETKDITISDNGFIDSN